MQELVDSHAFRSDGRALRERLASDGYVFIRGLLPAADVRAAYAGVAAELRRGGWIGGHDRPVPPPDALNFRAALGNPAFRRAIVSRDFNRLVYLGPLRAVIAEMLGHPSFPYPAKVLRTVYPERPPAVTRGRYIHQDYGGAGVQAMLPAPAQMVLGPLPGPAELFSRIFGREPWWQPVPAGLQLLPRGYVPRPPTASSFFAVHPGWRRWRPPPGQA